MNPLICTSPPKYLYQSLSYHLRGIRDCTFGMHLPIDCCCQNVAGYRRADVDCTKGCNMTEACLEKTWQCLTLRTGSNAPRCSFCR